MSWIGRNHTETRIQDVRKRTEIRSVVLQNILVRLREEKIPLASPRLVVESGSPS